MPKGWADIVIEPCQWSVFCADCSAGSFTETEAEAEEWERLHRASNHPNRSQDG